MNIIDLGILSIVFISILIGMYYGFTVSLFNIASFMISWLFSFLFYPLFTKGIMKRFPDLIEKVIYYSEGSSKILFADKTLPVSTLSGSEITRIVNSSGLPNPFNHNIHSNLTNQSLGGLSNVGQYFDHTVANIIINLGSFILLFLI
ncbi:MAG TPA: hypothetical protein VFD57_06760, partial [Clostridia bacterium]|nr:hypothetical protein [Clostridia bacterium]